MAVITGKKVDDVVHFIIIVAIIIQRLTRRVSVIRMTNRCRFFDV